MKKSIVVFFTILLTLILLINQTFATSDTENVGNLINVPAEGHEDPNKTEDEVQNGIMPISIDLEEQEYSQNYLEDDLYLASNLITIEESINGNVYLFGEQINISSSMILGNVFVIGEKVEINSDITGSIYVMAKEVVITGGADDAYIVAEKVDFEENSYISRNAKIVSDNVNIKGRIDRNLYSTANKTNILENKFGGVQGKLYYSGELNVADNAKIGEKIKIESKTQDLNNDAEHFFEVVTKAIEKIATATQIFTALIIIVVLSFISKKDEEKEVKENYFINILKGFGYLIVIPIISLMLLVTIIGIPVGIVLMFLYILALAISIPAVSLKLARIILKGKSDSKLVQILVALIIYVVFELIRFVPVIGGIIRFLVTLYGLSIVINFPHKNKTKKEDDKVIITNVD